LDGTTAEVGGEGGEVVVVAEGAGKASPGSGEFKQIRVYCRW